ncbi:MAG TPA: urate oxidase, partial [Candidatus Limnocylindria bacterium]|nr:urate oxidase [Candidatus Limnocylindria bacterium]
MKPEIRYGKAEVSVYRAHPGAERPLFAALVDVTVLGEEFLASYTEGDNTRVVATDSMKNFIHAMALEHEGATLESFAAFLGRRFLGTYPQIEALRVAVREVAFARVG